jgi:hypothetical protein
MLQYTTMNGGNVAEDKALRREALARCRAGNEVDFAGRVWRAREQPLAERGETA